MFFWIHFTLLLAILVAPVVLGVIYRSGPGRSLRELWSAFWPYLVLVVLSALTMNMKGKPINEWLYPALVSMLLVVVCRDDRAYRISWWTIYCTSVFLCVNFLTVMINTDFVRAVQRMEHAINMQSHNSKNEAQDALSESFPANANFEAGPVSKMLKEAKYDDLEVASAEPEWHTSLTWLWVLRKQKVMLWYPGGHLDSGRRNLEFRGAAQ